MREDMKEKYEDKVREVEAIYIKRLQEMSGKELIKISSDLFEVVKEIAKAGIIYQHPEISEEALKIELKKRVSRNL